MKNLNDKIKVTEKRLIKECMELASTFSTKDRNRVLKTSIELRVLKNLQNG